MEQHHVVYKHWRWNKSTGELEHYRRGKDSDGNKLTPWEPEERGGYTRCYLYEDGHYITQGWADCSKKDAFCYRLGREISRGRAMKALGV